MCNYTNRCFLAGVFACLISLIPLFLAGQCLSGNCKNGMGTYLYPSGAKYTGEFRYGQIDGQGMLVFSNGDVYNGQWKANYREGLGELQFKSGDQYKGSFEKSKFSGKGTMKYREGDIYDGEWKNDLAHGDGAYTFEYGDFFQGAFQKGDFHGQGVYFYSDGSRFEGSWHGNKRHGKGRLVLATGESATSFWEYGYEIKREPEEPSFYTADAVPELQLMDCNTEYCHDTRGIFTYEDGSYFEGDFRSGLPNGEGVCHYKNGDKYVGGWKHHSPHGEGVMYYTSGRAYGAMWSSGTPTRELDLHQSVILKKDVLKEVSLESKTWAVIIGISDYTFMPKLKYTDDDAYKMYAFLKSTEGGSVADRQIELLINGDATRSNIINAIQDVFLKADENDKIVLYYSGHGLKGSFIPIDYNGYENKLHHDDIQYVLDQSKAEVKLCLADACYSGSFDDTILDSQFGGSANSEVKKGSSAFLMSSSSQEVSLEGGGLGEGVFTHYLLRALKGEADQNFDKLITIQEIYDFVYQGVRAYSGNLQTPILTGDFKKHLPISMLP